MWKSTIYVCYSEPVCLLFIESPVDQQSSPHQYPLHHIARSLQRSIHLHTYTHRHSIIHTHTHARTHPIACQSSHMSLPGRLVEKAHLSRRCDKPKAGDWLCMWVVKSSIDSWLAWPVCTCCSDIGTPMIRTSSAPWRFWSAVLYFPTVTMDRHVDTATQTHTYRL